MSNKIYIGLGVAVVLGLAFVGTAFYWSLGNTKVFSKQEPEVSATKSAQDSADLMEVETGVSSTTEVLDENLHPDSLITIESFSAPYVYISYENLPPSGVRIKNSVTGDVVWTQDLGSGSGTTTIILPASLLPTGKYLAEAFISSGVVASSPVVGISNATDTLYLAFHDIQLRPITGITDSVAEGLCGLVFGDTCSWKSKLIPEKPFYISGSHDAQPRIIIENPTPKALLSYEVNTVIRMRDLGPVAGRYRVYLIHRDLLGKVNGVHEAHIVRNESINGVVELEWDHKEIHLDESGNDVIAQLREGTYELMVANIDTGVEGGINGTVHVGPASFDPSKALSKTSGFKPYASNTPLITTYWDGRGVFFNGKGGEDVMDLIGKRSEYSIFRGVEFPEKDEFNTAVFVQGGSVVIVSVNVEKITFDDETIYLKDLFAELEI